MIRQTSLEAYQALDLGRRQLIVYEGVKQYPSKTALELSRKMGRLDPNFVRPRLNELAKMGFVKEGNKRTCSISKRKALTWF